MPPVDDPITRYTVAVRELCAFAAKQGDLDLRFTPSPSAQEGVAGHQAVVARRGPGYQAEVPLRGTYRQLAVRGRADGFDAAQQRLEEIKTHKGDLAHLPDNHRALHWAQARVYGWLLCQQHGLAELTVALVYFDIGSQQETALAEQCTADTLRQHFEALCERFLGWAQQQLAHRQRRDAALQALPFVHASFRTGQRVLAENVFRAARLGRCLMAQAPTGIGKTLGTLFPMLKACVDQQLDKVFYLSAKGPGRVLALDALATMHRGAPGLPLRVVELVARDTACVHPDKACHGASCPLARGFYDRLPAARAAAVGGPDDPQPPTGLNAATIQAVARAHQVCPYYLSQELVRWADVVVGDVNYFFDSTALLHGLTVANQWRTAVLVDEAHNLVDRARAMYSAQLDQAAFRGVRRRAPAALKRPLDRLHRTWAALAKAQATPYQVHPQLPAKFIAALQEANGAIGDHLAEQQRPGAASPSADDDPGLLPFYFDALQFARLAESFGPHSLFDVTLAASPGMPGATAKASATLCIRNVVPAPFLQPRFGLTRTTVLFSATLTPQHYYGDLLGLPDDTAWLDVEPPFRSDQLAVRVVPDVSTRFQARARSLAPIADLMARQFSAAPGNYLAFFSSFDYLAQAAQAFACRHGGVPTWHQTRGMDEAARAAFLARFTPDGQGIGFAVLGGAFGEGIDLPGRRLIGAFIATLGLPQFNPVNEAMRERLDERFGDGHDYTYLFPGLRKVIQAAGRVIRTPSDEGAVFLIDDRFARPAVRRLLPGWWDVQVGGAASVPGHAGP